MSKFWYVDPDENARDPFDSDEARSEFEQLLETDGTVVSGRRFRVGESVTGQVMSVGQEFLFVDLGGKVAGSIAVDEYRVDGAAVVPRAGEEVTVFVRSDNGSEVILTRSLRRSEADDMMLRNAFEGQVPVDAKVEKSIKGGFEVSVGSRRGFVPISNMDIVTIDDPERYVGKVLKFIIMQYSGRNLVLSRRSILREEQEQRTRELLGTLEVGQSCRATITRLATFGAFADIGGVEGLIPMSELSWTRVKKADDVVNIGEVVHVKISKIEHSPKLRIGLTLKGAGEDPWISMATRLMPGTVMPGKVTKLAEYGAFVSVGDGIEGLVHVSQLSWEKRVGHPKEILAEGQDVPVHVLSVDLEKRKLSLSVKGPMPGDLATRIDAKRRGRQDLTPEEIEQASEWENFQKTVAQNPRSSDAGGTLAAAFARAKQRKS
jgi:small subunit ribosomal protein S1